MKPPQNINFDKEISSQLKLKREKLGLTQSQLAQKANMTVTYYAMIERGEVNPSWSKLKKLFDVLGIKLSLEVKH